MFFLRRLFETIRFLAALTALMELPGTNVSPKIVFFVYVFLDLGRWCTDNWFVN